VILDEAEALLDPVSDIEGFMLACLVDASTGMVLASRKDQDGISLPTAAAGAADIANVLSQLTGDLPVDGLEDVLDCHRHLTAHEAHPPTRRPSWSSTTWLTVGGLPDRQD
jgi:hypothetical protein